MEDAMRSTCRVDRHVLACLAGAVALLVSTGCGGGGDRAATNSGDSTAAVASSTTSAATSPAASGDSAAKATATGAGGTGTARPATGKTWDVKMLGDAKGYHFEPATLTIKSGDAVRWTVVSGPPHNVSFWADSIPAGAAAQLGANMPETMGPLVGPLRPTVNETYTVSFAGVPAGTYKYYCTPHLALGMKASLTVE